MKITVPHCGQMDIFINAVCRKIGPDFIIPPKTSPRTLDLGIKYSPESTCLPFKFILGNFIEALEKGADTICMISDHGPCRVGMYDIVMQNILREMGYQFTWITLDNARILKSYLLTFDRERRKRKVSLMDALRALHFGWKKMKVCEEIERWTQKIRPYEVNRGETTRVFSEYLRLIDGVANSRELQIARGDALSRLATIEQDRTRHPLKMVITGEGYMVINPHANQDIERRLGEMGVEVTRTMWFTSQISYALRLDLLKKRSKSKAIRASKRYLPHNIGGECNASIGYAILYAREGYNGVIQLLPFGCILESVAKNILRIVSRDYDIPILTFSLAENLSETTIMTRLSAFVDLIQRRRKGKERCPYA
jgi:predicted nucleotide-binding protein (sugar kinase/HSP70/actin superfamily)